MINIDKSVILDDGLCPNSLNSKGVAVLNIIDGDGKYLLFSKFKCHMVLSTSISKYNFL